MNLKQQLDESCDVNLDGQRLGTRMLFRIVREQAVLIEQMREALATCTNEGEWGRQEFCVDSVAEALQAAKEVGYE